MTVTFQLAGFLRSFSGGAREVRLEVPGGTVGDALRVLGRTDGASYLNRKYAAKGKTVVDLVQYHEGERAAVCGRRGR